MPTTVRSTVVGVFDDRQKAEEAVGALRRDGFRDEHIGYLRKGVAEERTGLKNEPSDTRWEEGAGVGAAAGAATGLGLGIAAVAGVIPPLGVIAGGTVLALLASAGSGAVAGGVVGALVGLGVPDEEARTYERQVEEGGTLVTVKAEDRIGEAADILRRYGARHLNVDDGAGGAAYGVELPATPY